MAVISGSEKKMTMKTASYQEGIQWIADNDAPGDNDEPEDLAYYISSLLLADLFGVEPEKVGQDIFAVRAEQHK